MTPTLDPDARRRRWQAPERPDWVARINSEGRHFDLRAVVPLDERSLIDAAVRTTGLDDFGDDDWREPFLRFIASADEESELTLMGRLMLRSDIVNLLQARLQIEATYKAHPEIEDEEIVKPLLIIGQGRSGTSMLQNVLSADPRNGTMRTWEAIFPCPPPEAATYDTDPRVARADALVTMWNRVTPTIESMHEFNAVVPTENIQMQALSFQALAWFNVLAQVPSYSAYMMQKDPAEAYRYEKRVLKLLQWHNPRRTWVMKSPFALTHLPSVLEVYPDIGFIWTHRDPVKALSSVVSLVGTLHWMRSDNPFIGDSLAQFTNSDLAAGMITQPIGWLESGVVPRERLCNIQYLDLVADPLGTIAQIYAAFDLELSDTSRAAMQAYMDANPRSSRPTHDYDIGTQDEIALEREAFAAYVEYFDVPAEI